MYQWPANSDSEAWAQLANLALQLDTLRADLDENARWEGTIRALVARQLPHDQFVAEHLEALKERMRRRKLDQANIRYRYGYRAGDRARRAALIRSDIRRSLSNNHPA